MTMITDQFTPEELKAFYQRLRNYINAEKNAADITSYAEVIALQAWLQRAQDEIARLHDENERLTAERDVWKIACNAQANEVERLRAERRVIPGTNIPDAGTPSY